MGVSVPPAGPSTAVVRPSTSGSGPRRLSSGPRRPRGRDRTPRPHRRSRVDEAQLLAVQRHRDVGVGWSRRLGRRQQELPAHPQVDQDGVARVERAHEVLPRRVTAVTVVPVRPSMTAWRDVRRTVRSRPISTRSMRRPTARTSRPRRMVSTSGSSGTAALRRRSAARRSPRAGDQGLEGFAGRRLLGLLLATPFALSPDRGPPPPPGRRSAWHGRALVTHPVERRRVVEAHGKLLERGLVVERAEGVDGVDDPPTEQALDEVVRNVGPTVQVDRAPMIASKASERIERFCRPPAAASPLPSSSACPTSSSSATLASASALTMAFRRSVSLPSSRPSSWRYARSATTHPSTASPRNSSRSLEACPATSAPRAMGEGLAQQGHVAEDVAEPTAQLMDLLVRVSSP